MKKAAIILTLLVGGAAIAQTTTDHSAMGHDTTTQSTTSTAPSTADTTTTYSTTSQPMATTMAPAGSPVVQPSNANPERDARGIVVISDPALVPAGFNGLSGAAMGGPLLDPATGEAVSEAADASYPACSKTVTDNCLQAYERGRSS
jgi:hypothetical protein